MGGVGSQVALSLCAQVAWPLGPPGREAPGLAQAGALKCLLQLLPVCLAPRGAEPAWPRPSLPFSPGSAASPLTAGGPPCVCFLSFSAPSIPPGGVYTGRPGGQARCTVGAPAWWLSAPALLCPSGCWWPWREFPVGAASLRLRWTAACFAGAPGAGLPGQGVASGGEIDAPSFPRLHKPGERSGFRGSLRRPGAAAGSTPQGWPGQPAACLLLLP